MVGYQSKAVDGPEDGRLAHASGPRRRTDGEQVRAATGHPPAAEVHRNRDKGQCQSVEILSGAGADLPPRLRGVDSHSEAGGDARAAYSRIARPIGAGKEARLEVGG